MLYAKVVLGLPIEGPFDYVVPVSLYKKIKVGCRVWINFRDKRKLGYVVKLTQQTNIKNLKTILEVIDELPILDKNMLSLTRELSDYYCCSWGEAIETALPEALRKGRKIHIQGQSPLGMSPSIAITKDENRSPVTLIHDLDGRERWDIYLKSIKETLDKNKSVVVLLADKVLVLKVKNLIQDSLGISPGVSYRNQPKELEEWIRIKEREVNVVIGTRSSIFAPLDNLGLVIMDEEEDTVYKQDRVPHYHARQAALIRINIEKAQLILGSSCPSLESFYLAQKNKFNPSTTLRIDGERSRTIKYTFIPRKKDFPQIKVIDARTMLSKYLIDCIAAHLNTQAKILLFLNRRGFATFATCNNCGRILKCARCNINLVYHFKDNVLNCHYCNFKTIAYKICPHRNSGYIKYSGTGTEKIESELARLFPQAELKRLDILREIDLENVDICISTKRVIKETNYDFNLTAVLDIDNSLNRIDFRSGEKTFDILVRLSGLTQKNLIIQTRLPNHHCFKALEAKDMNIFYDEELRQRKELNFPPYQHIGLVKLRGKNEERVKEISNTLFVRLKKYSKNKKLKMSSVHPAQPAKLRDNFYWQILVMADRAERISEFLKIYLKDFSRSGIIVTVDIDPI